MRISCCMLILLLVGLSTPASVCAETSIYFRGQPVFVPPSIVLLVAGIALLAVGGWVRRLLRNFTEASEPLSVRQVGPRNS